MKKTVLFSLLLAGACFCAFAQSGVIRECTGEVELKRAGASAFVKARAGDAVGADTIVSTGFKSTANIEVGNSTIAVRALTRLSLAEIKTASDAEPLETLNVNLQTGRLKVDVKPPAGTRASCTVQGPSATASVRGTSFEVDTRNLMVYEGAVAFRGSKGKGVLIPAGMVSYVDGGGRAVDPFGASAVAAAKSLRNGLPSFEPDSGYIKIVE